MIRESKRGKNTESAGLEQASSSLSVNHIVAHSIISIDCGQSLIVTSCKTKSPLCKKRGFFLKKISEGNNLATNLRFHFQLPKFLHHRFHYLARLPCQYGIHDCIIRCGCHIHQNQMSPSFFCLYR